MNRRHLLQGLLGAALTMNLFRKSQAADAPAPAVAPLKKTEDGPVVWREDKCMGCRFCMISCPFDAPKFDYDRAVPSIHKCQMCQERLAEGGIPACVENCPAEALAFGRRSEMLAEARRRIVQNPGTYVDHVYGEREVGGTGYLYLSAVPFEQLDQIVDRLSIMSFGSGRVTSQRECVHLTDRSQASVELDAVMRAGQVLEESAGHEQENRVVATQRHRRADIGKFGSTGECGLGGARLVESFDKAATVGDQMEIAVNCVERSQAAIRRMNK